MDSDFQCTLAEFDATWSQKKDSRSKWWSNSECVLFISGSAYPLLLCIKGSLRTIVKMGDQWNIFDLSWAHVNAII